MRMVSSYQLHRIEDDEPTRMLTVCLCSEIEDCEAQRIVSSYPLSRTSNYEAMRMVSTYLFRVPLRQICTRNLAGPRIEGRPWLDRNRSSTKPRRSGSALDSVVFSNRNLSPLLRVTRKSSS